MGASSYDDRAASIGATGFSPTSLIHTGSGRYKVLERCVGVEHLIAGGGRVALALKRLWKHTQGGRTWGGSHLFQDATADTQHGEQALKMVHPEAYRHAHRRHWKDAELLFKQRRWANADQLYGLSAECGLKALMPDLGMPMEKKHVEEIWPEFAQFATAADGRVNARYVALLPSGTPFSSWSVQNRYAHDRHFPKAVVEPHRKAACAVRQMIDVAIQDGIQI